MNGESFYVETVSRKSTGEGRIQRQLRTGYEFARVSVSVEPATGFHLLVPPALVPKDLVEHIETGLLKAISAGPSGFRLINLAAVVSDAAYHDVDSTPAAMEEAAEVAGRIALAQASPVLLESVSSVSLRVTAKFIGEVIGDIASRRGAVESIRGERDLEISALVPTAELEDYAVELSNMTGGSASFSSRFSKYQRVPEAFTVGLWCGTCNREVILPMRRGRPYREDCPSCGSRLHPGDSPGVL